MTERSKLAVGSTMLVAALLLANAAVVLRLVWGHLNYVQIDHAGHIASAAAFARGEYHQFTDQAFLGFVHGLFYPPLQDALLGGLDWLTGHRYVLAYKLYLSLLVIAYLGAITHLVVRFERRRARAVVLAGLLFLLNIEKPDLIAYQGLSFVDLWLTGLSSQVLGGVFLFVLIREWLGEARPRRLGAWLALCLLSHLVVGFVALLLVVAIWVQDRRRDLGLALLAALGLTAFFWLPFAVNRSTITNSNILLLDPWMFAALAALGLGLGLRHRKARILFALALVLLAPMIVGPWFSELGVPYPRFHYYRFAIIALFLIVIGYAVLVEAVTAETVPWRRWALYGAIALACGVGLITFRFQRFDRQAPSLTASDVRVDDPRVLELPEYGRFWVIGDQRSVDFGIDSMLAANHPEFRSTKGLFWESYRHNTLLTSWYATLLGLPVVLDYFYYYGYSCEVQRCLVDRFVHDYNVGGLIVDERLALPYVRAPQRECYRKILQDGGTPGFSLVEQGAIADGPRSYRVFRVDPRGPLSNRAIEPIARSELVPFDATQDRYFADPIIAAYTGCTKGTPVPTFVDHRDLATLPEAPAAAPAKLSFTKRADGVFEIVIDSPEPILFLIKLAKLPGVELIGEAGEVPLAEGMGGMIAYGRGTLELRYRRPPGVVAGYLISLLVATGLLARWLVPRIRRRRSGAAAPAGDHQDREPEH